MFFVSSITGSVTPFDPALTPISNRTVSGVGTVPATEGVNFLSQLENQTKLSPTAVVASTGTDSSNQTISTTQLKTGEEAAKYEGHALLSTDAQRILGSSQNVGIAGALAAYQHNEAEGSRELERDDASYRVESAQQSSTVDDDSTETPGRVNPIRRANYRYQPPQRERKRVVVAGDIMSAPVFSLSDDATLETAQRVFKERQFRHIPIISKAGMLVGIVSDRDFIGQLPESEGKRTVIRERMVTNILTARTATEIRSIAEVMIEHRLGCIPITDEGGALVGIITRSDILRAIVNHAPIELWT